MVGKKRGYNTLHLTLASRGPAMKFDLDQLVSDCRKAVRENAPQAPISEILARSLSDRASLVSALGEPKRAEMQKLYQGSDLTILNVIWAPWMTLLPHNHKMWAVIGIYSGRADNIFWGRLIRGHGAGLGPFADGLHLFRACHAERLRALNLCEQDVGGQLLLGVERRVQSGNDELFDFRAGEAFAREG